MHLGDTHGHPLQGGGFEPVARHAERATETAPLQGFRRGRSAPLSTYFVTTLRLGFGKYSGSIQILPHRPHTGCGQHGCSSAYLVVYRPTAPTCSVRPAEEVPRLAKTSHSQERAQICSSLPRKEGSGCLWRSRSRVPRRRTSRRSGSCWIRRPARRSPDGS